MTRRCIPPPSPRRPRTPAPGAGDGLPLPVGNVGDVPIWRRLAIAGTLAFVVAAAVWAFRPWTSAVSLPVVDNKSPQALFSCGAPLGSDKVDPANADAESASALPHRPCTTRGARRALALADLAVGSVGVVLLVAYKRPHAEDLEPQHERH